MLIQFTVENFLSLKQKTVFSLLATNDEAHPEHLIASPTGKSKKVLRAAAIYGANAAGKSNLVKAMAFAQKLIVNGTASGNTIAVTPFKLRSNSNLPTRFQFVFTHKNVEYSYGFKLNNSRILEEFLYASPNGKEVKYFERVTSDDLDTQVEFGPSLIKGRAELRRLLRYKEADTRPNQLFLTAIFDGNIKEKVDELKPVMDWFRSALIIIEAESTYSNLEVRTHKSEGLKEFIGTLLRTSGTGIQEVVTTEEVLDWNRDLPSFPIDEREEILQEFKKQSLDGITDNTLVEIFSPPSTRFYLHQNEAGEVLLLKFLLKHESEQDDPIEFQMNEESDGTQRVIHLAPMLFDISKGGERVIVIDEIDRRLHPHLSRLIIQVALECSSANQLIFTTHDTNLLDLELLRRDEIWFVEKNESGGSHLYSLAEFKVRPDLQIEKGYLNGRFGAIPFIGDIGSLGWNTKPAVDAKEADPKKADAKESIYA